MRRKAFVPLVLLKQTWTDHYLCSINFNLREEFLVRQKCDLNENGERWNVLRLQNILELKCKMLICCIMNANRDVWSALLATLWKFRGNKFHIRKWKIDSSIFPIVLFLSSLLIFQCRFENTLSYLMMYLTSILLNSRHNCIITA